MILYIFNVYNNMANFYNADNIIIDTVFEYPCLYKDIYILGLNEGEVLISYNPQFMQNTNGMVIGIDSRFKQFYIVNSDNSILKSLKLIWNSNCSDISNTSVKTNNYVPIIGISIVFTLVLIVIVVLIRRKK